MEKIKKGDEFFTYFEDYECLEDQLLWKTRDGVEDALQEKVDDGATELPYLVEITIKKIHRVVPSGMSFKEVEEIKVKSDC